MEQRPNYRNKKRKTIKIVDKKKFVLAILLTLSTLLNGIVLGEKAIDKIIERNLSFDEYQKYGELINENTPLATAYQQPFIDTKGVAEDMLKLDVNSKEDVYHILINLASNIDYNRTENFNNILKDIDLDKVVSINPNYPTTQELYEFLDTYGLLNEDGSINFEAWEKYDDEAFYFDNQQKEEGRERKASW